MEPRTPPPPGAPASARSPPSSPVSPRRASSEHVQLARELWFLRELARVQAAERTFLADLTRLLRRGVDASAGRVRRDDEWTSALPPEGADVFESFPPPRSPAAPARESAANDLLRDAEVARAQQRVTNMSADFRARLEGGMDSDRARGLTRTPSWGALPAQRAVSSALESAFRHELEGLLVRRGRQPAAMYASRGDAGAAAVDLVDRVDNALDALSGGDARRVEQGVAALREEVAALKHAIDAGFDIQLDIQRAVRQEVAAAMHAQSRPPVTAETSACTAGETSLPDVSALVAPRRHQRVVDGGACVICLDKPVDSLLYACGHMCTCAQCGRQLIANGEACPVCRAPIRDVVVAYMAR